MWLVYPTVAGWHYKVESSMTPDEEDFSLVPWTFSYGDGADHRYLVSLPPPPPGTSPPGRDNHTLSNIEFRVARDPGMQKVQISRNDYYVEWGIVVDRALPVRESCISVFCMGSTSTENWAIFGMTCPMDSTAFSYTSEPLQSTQAQEELDFILAHWDELVGSLTPNPADAALLPAPPSMLPDPAPGARRFYRVTRTEVDTNGNRLWDWWEIENAYSAFATASAASYADPLGDPDGDGLSNEDEQFYHTDPRNPDTDGDSAPDGEEVAKGTDPNDPASCPTELVGIHRSLFYYIDTNYGPPDTYYHTRGFEKWSPNDPGWESLANEPHVDSLPMFETLRAKLISKVAFPTAMPQPPAWWVTADSVNAFAHAWVPAKGAPGGASIGHQRFWLRSPAPTQETLLTPVLKQHVVAGNPITVTSFVRVLETPVTHNYSSNHIDLLPGLSAHNANAQNDPDGDGFFTETESVVQYLALLLCKVEGASPLLDEDTGAITAGTDLIPDSTKTVLLVEENPTQNRIAHRILYVRIGNAGELAGREVTWSMQPLFVPLPPQGQQGPQQPVFRGAWTQAAATHQNCFEANPAVAATNFQGIDQATATTAINADGFTSIRVNLPPVGFNKARIFIQVANAIDPTDEAGTDNDEPFPLVDVEVPAVIVIDPGHGGTVDVFGSSANNAVSPSGVLEKTMTLDYCLALRDSLRTKRDQDDLQLRVLMTRDTDVNMRGDDRAFIARDNGADVHFVLHFNSDDDDRNGRIPHQSRGTLEVYRTTNNVVPGEDTLLSSTVIDRMVAAMTPFDAGANHRARVLYGGDGVNGPAVSSDVFNGNTAGYHPVRIAYIEGEFIDFGANTPADHTNDAVDILLNTGPNAAAVKTLIVNAIGDGILQDLRTQP